MSAWISGFLGLALSLWIGTSVLSLEQNDVLWAIVGSNLGGLIGATLTLRAEKVPQLKATLLRGAAGTWAFLAVLYFSILLALAPVMRERNAFFWLVVPVIMSSGLMLNWFFGPLQDWFFRRSNAIGDENLQSES
ncbi:MAG: hypothetical protein NDJ89_02460 [Oligoflexia bacterium]|nr:hypothetical protein [Oligoflexia bacterium]